MPDETPDANAAAPAEGGALRPPRTSRLSVRVSGFLRGHELAGPAVAELDADEVVLVGDAARRVTPSGRLALPVAALDGARVDGDQLTLFVHGGDAVELTGARIATLAESVLRVACELPEQTLRLRHFGTARANPGSDHDRFFGPLMDARRSVPAGATPEAQVAAFDSGALHAAFERTLHAFAAERYRREGPDRRALEAELFELAEPLLSAVDALGIAALGVRTAADDVSFAHWRLWAAAAQRVFAEADRWWAGALAPLSDTRGRRGRLWRRVLRLGR